MRKLFSLFCKGTEAQRHLLTCPRSHTPKKQWNLTSNVEAVFLPIMLDYLPSFCSFPRQEAIQSHSPPNFFCLTDFFFRCQITHTRCFITKLTISFPKCCWKFTKSLVCLLFSRHYIHELTLWEYIVAYWEVIPIHTIISKKKKKALREHLPVQQMLPCISYMILEE